MNSIFSFVFVIYFSINFQIIDNNSLRRNYPGSNKVNYSGARVVRVVPEDHQQLLYLFSLQKDPRVKMWVEPNRVGSPVDIMIYFPHIQQIQYELEDMELIAEVLIQDVGNKIKQDRLQFYTTLRAENPFFDNFRRYSEIYKFLNEKHKQNPDLTSVESIGNSFEGQSIWCIKIGVGLGSPQKEVVYIDGGSHGREWGAVSTALYIVEHLIDDYRNGDKDVKSLLKNFDFLIVPVVNPDGYEYSHTKDRMWRKNRALLPNTQCIGTDLNRNYPFHWGGPGSSHIPCDETFAGLQPASEPEVKAVIQLILSHKDRIKAFITLHSYGQMILYPWGWTDEYSPNAEELQRVAIIGYKALYKVHQNRYKVGSAGQISTISQGSDDWAHGISLIPYVYNLEISDIAKQGFLLPKSEIIPTGEEIYAAVKAMVGAIVNTRRKPNSNISQLIS